LLALRDRLEVVFPVHPRTRQRMSEFAVDLSRLRLLEPLPYIEFLALQRHAAVVITDSGGIQEETTYLRVPCLTLRSNTERPVTVNLGTNIMVGDDLTKIEIEVQRVLAGAAKSGSIPPLWDGRAAERIAEIVTRE
jgi:UDP-N-acetylglucosamine 2-epimerase (non-hydrolysing)